MTGEAHGDSPIRTDAGHSGRRLCRARKHYRRVLRAEPGDGNSPTSITRAKSCLATSAASSSARRCGKSTRHSPAANSIASTARRCARSKQLLLPRIFRRMTAGTRCMSIRPTSACRFISAMPPNAEEVLTKLRQSELRFRLMADSIPQMVWIADAAGRAEFFNRQWSAYTGSNADATGEDIATTMSIRTTWQPRPTHGTRRGGTRALSASIHCSLSASGEYRWFLVRAEPGNRQWYGQHRALVRHVHRRPCQQAG